jgi:hypothetical protein
VLGSLQSSALLGRLVLGSLHSTSRGLLPGLPCLLRHLVCQVRWGTPWWGPYPDLAFCNTHPMVGWVLLPHRPQPSLMCFCNRGGGNEVGSAPPLAGQLGGNPMWGFPPSLTPWGYPAGLYPPGFGSAGYSPAGGAGTVPPFFAGYPQQPQPIPLGGTGAAAAGSSASGVARATVSFAGPSSAEGAPPTSPVESSSHSLSVDSDTCDEVSDGASSVDDEEDPALLHLADERGEAEEELMTVPRSALACDLSSELPDFTSDILQRVSNDLGLAWDVEAEPEVARVLSLRLPHAEATAISPAFHMPADILELCKRSSSIAPSTFSRSLRVTEDDYHKLLHDPTGERCRRRATSLRGGREPFLVTLPFGRVRFQAWMAV